MHALVLFMLALLALSVSGCTIYTVGDASFVAYTDSPGASILSVTSTEQPRIDIYCDTGIGEADFWFADNALPDNLVFRLHLNGLESLSYSSDVTVRASVASYGDFVVTQSIIIDGVETAIESDSPYWLTIMPGPTAEGPTTYFDVRPSALQTQNTNLRFTLSWIDFYR